MAIQKNAETQRVDQQRAIVARAAEEFGKGKGVDNSTTGALLLYIQELEAENLQLQRAYLAEQRSSIALQNRMEGF